MIDWQVRIDGHAPPGWDQYRDGCWFPDFDYQGYLLPYFDVGRTPIDEYGATVFEEADLMRLKTHLLKARDELKAKPRRWTVAVTSPDGGRMVAFERAKILAVVDKTIGMIEFALSRRGTLIFRGD